MNHNRVRSLKNLLYSAVGQIVTITVGLILPRLFIISYGSETNGLLSSVTQFLVYLGLFEAGVGAATMQALYKPVAEDDRKKISAILSATNQYYKKAGRGYILSLIAFCAIYPLIIQSALNYLMIFGIVFFSGIGNAVMFYLQGKYKLLLQTEGKGYILTNLTTVTVVATGLSKVVLIKCGLSVVAVLAVTFLIQLLQAVYIVIYVRRNYCWLSLEEEPDEKAISQRNFVLFHQLAGMVFMNTDVLILSVCCNMVVVSIYSLYKLIISHLESILSIFSSAFSFDLGQTYQVDRRLYVQKIDLFESMYSIISFSLFSVALNTIIPFMNIYTRGVTDAVYCDPFIALMFVVIALLTTVRHPMLLTINYAGHFKNTVVQSMIETILNLIVSIIGCIYFGIYGVLSGTIVALIYRTTDIVIYSNSKLLDRKPWKTFGIHATNAGIMLMAQIIYRIVSPKIDSYLTFALVGAVDMIITTGAMLAAQCLVFPDFRMTIFAVAKRIVRR